MFPPPFIIVGGREHKPTVNDWPTVLHLGNQPVLVALDIEDRTHTARIGVRKVAPRLGEIAPSRFFRPVTPIRQRLFRIRMGLPEFSPRSLADNTH